MNAAISCRHVCFSSAALIAAVVAQPETGLAQGLVLDGDRLANPANPKQFVKVGEILPVAALKKRFPGYSIIATVGEDCLVCAFGSGENGTLGVYYDEHGIRVNYIEGDADVFGNMVGGSLHKAVGATADCSEGESQYCSSPRLKGLSYTVDEGGCPLTIKEGKAKTAIPECALIRSISASGNKTAAQSAPAHAHGFIFGGGRVINPADQKEYIQIGEPLPVEALAKRFSRYKITPSSGQSRTACITVTGKIGAFEVCYEDDGLRIKHVESRDSGSADFVGHSIGDRLQDAVQAEAQCSTTGVTLCTSPRLRSVHYVVKKDSACPLTIDNGKASIPDCAVIAGVRIDAAE
jgi:hypothetical protein